MDFHGDLYTADSREKRTFRVYVRDMKINAKLNMKPVEKLLTERGQWSSEEVNYGVVSVCRFRDFVDAADELLAQDPLVLVENRPEKD